MRAMTSATASNAAGRSAVQFAFALESASFVIHASSFPPCPCRHPTFSAGRRRRPGRADRLRRAVDVEWLLDAYRHGIFPWPITDFEAPLAWWSPDPRAVIEFDRFHVSRRLRRTCRSGKFKVTRDRDFAGVIRGCAMAPSRVGQTWLTPEMIDAYIRLHDRGHAHSVEVWHGGDLAGGVYGVGIGGLFSAESKFYRVRDASKVALGPPGRAPAQPAFHAAGHSAAYASHRAAGRRGDPAGRVSCPARRRDRVARDVLKKGRATMNVHDEGVLKGRPLFSPSWQKARWLSVGLLLAGMVGPAVAAAVPPQSVVLYVSPNGHDEWSGRLPDPNPAGNDGPLATLTRARDVVRQIMAGGRQADPNRREGPGAGRQVFSAGAAPSRRPRRRNPGVSRRLCGVPRRATGPERRPARGAAGSRTREKSCSARSPKRRAASGSSGNCSTTANAKSVPAGPISSPAIPTPAAGPGWRAPPSLRAKRPSASTPAPSPPLGQADRGRSELLLRRQLGQQHHPHQVDRPAEAHHHSGPRHDAATASRWPSCPTLRPPRGSRTSRTT